MLNPDKISKSNPEYLANYPWLFILAYTNPKVKTNPRAKKAQVHAINETLKSSRYVENFLIPYS